MPSHTHSTRVLFPSVDCGSRDNFECSGPSDAGELRDALIGPGSGYDKSTRPKVALKRAQRSSSGGFWPPEKDEAWAQLRILSIDNIDTKTQRVTLQVYLNVIWFDWRLAFNTTAVGGCMPIPKPHAPGWGRRLAGGEGEGEEEGDHSKEGPSGDVSYGGDLVSRLWEPTLYAENMIQETVMTSAVWLASSGRVWWRRKAQWILQVPMIFRWTAWSKCPPWQCPSSPPVPPQGAPGGSGRVGTPRVEARPLGAPPPPRAFKRAASKVANFTAFIHPGYMPFDEQRLFARISSWQYPPEQLKITFGSPERDGQNSGNSAVIDDECRPQNSEWTVLATWSKCLPWQCPSSPPVPPQGAPGDFRQLGTPRVRSRHWAPRYRLGGSSELPPKSQISLRLIL